MFSNTSFSSGHLGADFRSPEQIDSDTAHDLQHAAKIIDESKCINVRNRELLQQNTAYMCRIADGISAFIEAGILTERNVGNLIENSQYFHGAYGDNIAGCFKLAAKLAIPPQDMFNLLIENAKHLRMIDLVFCRLDHTLTNRSNFLTLIRYAQFADDIEKSLRKLDPSMRKIYNTYGVFYRISRQDEFDKIINKYHKQITNALLVGKIQSLKETSQFVFFSEEKRRVERLHPLKNGDIFKHIFKYL